MSAFAPLLGNKRTSVISASARVHRALPRTLPFTFAWDETLDVGLDTGTPVDDRDYQVPFAFTGRLNRITVDTGETSATPEACWKCKRACSSEISAGQPWTCQPDKLIPVTTPTRHPPASAATQRR
jgi:hypothetical protein